jgi:hypothetical protein
MRITTNPKTVTPQAGKNLAVISYSQASRRLVHQALEF